jgi:hypothetical protein
MLRVTRWMPGALLAVTVASVTPACAAQSYGYRQGRYDRELERRAYDNGYRDGVKAGEKDTRSRRAYSLERHDDWRDADDGYHREYGDRDFYRRIFRDGFRAGYSETFNRYASVYPAPGSVVIPYPGSTYPGRVYGSRAADIGYRDGLEAGRDDARDRDNYDPVRSSRYRSADHDYDNRYGSKDDYKREYRDAFRRGYDEGYRNWRR